MIKKEVTKFWITSEELLEKFGFKSATIMEYKPNKSDLLMDVVVRKNPNAPLGFQIQGIDIFVEQPTEVKEEGTGE